MPDKGNQGVGYFSFVKIYNFFLSISFFSISLLYHFFLLHPHLYPRPTTFSYTLDCTYHSDVAERRKRLEAVGWNSGYNVYNVTPKKRTNGGHFTPYFTPPALSCAWVIKSFLTVREFPGILSLGPDTSDIVNYKETAKTSVHETQNSVIFRRGELRVLS